MTAMEETGAANRKTKLRSSTCLLQGSRKHKNKRLAQAGSLKQPLIRKKLPRSKKTFCDMKQPFIMYCSSHKHGPP